MERTAQAYSIALWTAEFILAVYALFAVINNEHFLADNFVSMALLLLIHYVARKNGLPLYTFVLMCLWLFIHNAGSLGLYGQFLFGTVIGYDKVVHFFTGLFVVPYIYHLIRRSDDAHWLAWALLAFMGFAALAEMNEFVGTRFFGVDNGGIFAIGDTLPEVKSDLQKYDTYYDLFFNLAGALIACVALGLIRSARWYPRASRYG